jgi:hypothetical protein
LIFFLPIGDGLHSVVSELRQNAWAMQGGRDRQGF